MRKMKCLIIVAGYLLSIALSVPAHGVELNWWNQFGTQDGKKMVFQEVKRRFEAKHPGDHVTITYYELANIFPALRATLTAGSGFPDVFFFGPEALEFLPAGWLADLSTGIRWENMEPYAKAFWTVPGPGGKMGTWALGVEAASDELYFNKKLFRQLGISVPANNAFTEDGFKEVVSKCARGGYAAFATGGADREWAALFAPTYFLLSKLGIDDLQKLGRGELSWKDPRVLEVLRYYKELIDLGAYAKTLTSMTLADAHRYFHTEQKACMFPNPSWYVGRAFVPPEKGGQPKDFELGLLNYPLMKNGKGHHEKFLGISASYAAAPKGEHLALAKELLNTFADPEIGNFWMAQAGTNTGIKANLAKLESPNKPYFVEYNAINKSSKWVNLTSQTVQLVMKPGLWQVWVATVGQGMPNKLIGPDEAVAKLEEARLKGR